MSEWNIFCPWCCELVDGEHHPVLDTEVDDGTVYRMRYHAACVNAANCAAARLGLDPVTPKGDWMKQRVKIGDTIHTKGGDCCVRHYGCVRRMCVSRIHHETTSQGVHMICEDCPEDAECWSASAWFKPPPPVT